MDGGHDVGGMQGFGAVVRAGSGAPYHQRWEPRVFALHLLIGAEGLGGQGPGGRPVREEMDPEHYLAASYYERWLWSAEQILLRAGTIATGEVDEMMQRLADGEVAGEHHDDDMAQRIVGALREPAPFLPPPTDATFGPGDRVRVRRMRPSGHTRCPRFVRGATGVVEAVRGADRLPDRTYYGQDVEPEPLYSVRFRSVDLWGPTQEPPWVVLLDMWDSYLEAA